MVEAVYNLKILFETTGHLNYDLDGDCMFSSSHPEVFC